MDPMLRGYAQVEGLDMPSVVSGQQMVRHDGRLMLSNPQCADVTGIIFTVATSAYNQTLREDNTQVCIQGWLAK